MFFYNYLLRERKPPPRQLQCRWEARWRPLASQRISLHALSGNSGAVIR